MESGWTEAEPPWELVEVWLCDAFHCSPEQLDEMDADRILQYWVIKNTYEEYAAKRVKVHSAHKR